MFPILSQGKISLDSQNVIPNSKIDALLNGELFLSLSSVPHANISIYIEKLTLFEPEVEE